MYDEMMDKSAVRSARRPYARAIIGAAAIKGKHVYAQSPNAHDLQSRWLGELAKKHGVCTQMGNQGSVDDGLRKTAAQYAAGVVGEVTEVHVWTNRPIWPQGINRTMTLEKFAAQMREEETDDAE